MRVEIGTDDVGREVVTEVEHQMVDAELLRGPPGVVDVSDRAAARVALAAPQLHRDPDHLVARVPQERGGDGGIHPAAHRHEHVHDRPDLSRPARDAAAG